MKSWTDPVSLFHFTETVQVFSNPTPITKEQHQPPVEQKPATIRLTTCKCSKLRRLACNRAEAKASNHQGNKKNLGLTSMIISIKAGWRDTLLALLDFKQRNKEKGLISAGPRYFLPYSITPEPPAIKAATKKQKLTK